MYLLAQIETVRDNANRMTEWSAQLRDSVVESLSALASTVAQFIPSLVGATAILMLGYLLSKVLQRVARGVLSKLRLDDACARAGMVDSLEKVGVSVSPSEMMGKLVFWLFMLTTLICASDALGLENVSRTIDSFVGYLPHVMGAALIVVIGLMLANFVRKLVEGAADRIGFEYAKPVGSLVYGMLLIVIGTLAIGQLQIETALLNRVIEIVLIAVGAALALSLGFGTRETARNVVAGVYARESFQPGAKLVVGPDRGVVDHVGAVNTVVKAQDGSTLYVPNGQLVEMVVKEEA